MWAVQRAKALFPRFARLTSRSRERWENSEVGGALAVDRSQISLLTAVGVPLLSTNPESIEELTNNKKGVE